jgi:hypothetical protein
MRRSRRRDWRCPAQRGQFILSPEGAAAEIATIARRDAWVIAQPARA